MADIFLSYNREDVTIARRYAEAFEREGLSVWWDVALRSGEAYDEVTEAALRGAKAVVVLWSPRSVVSRWVRAEATVADRCKTLVPVTIEPCERPIMFELTQTADLSHWTGDSVDRAWLALVDDVRRMTAKAVRPDLETSASTVEPPTVEETLKPGQSGSAPSLAVLPFTNRSGLDEDEVFAVGMVEDVISALTQGVNVRVLGSMSMAHLRKSETADLSAVGRRLGVRYLLEGNVRRVGANLRVTTQLLEAASGEIAWTGKFDRPLTELASLQEELVTEVAASLDAQVNSLETERALRKPSDLTAWEAVTRSLSTLRRFDSEGLQRAIGEAARAVTIAPDYAAGHARLANTLGNAYFSLGTNDPAEVQRIRAIAERALSLGPDDALVLIFAGIALCSIGYPDEGVRHTSRAARKAPGSAMIHHIHGFALCFAGEPEKALSHIETATRLDPEAQAMWLMKGFQATALVALGRWTEAQTAVDECIALNPVYALSYVTKALVLDHDGKHGEALKQIELARGLGQQLERTERAFRGLCPKSPTLETNIAAIRALFVATEAGA